MSKEITQEHAEKMRVMLHDVGNRLINTAESVEARGLDFTGRDLRKLYGKIVSLLSEIEAV